MGQGTAWMRAAAILLGALGFAFVSALAYAAEEPLYESDPTLSLIGNCTTILGIDPVPDPSCPYSPPPAGPTGQFDRPRPVVVDTFGNEYVVSFAAGDDAKGRVDVFDDEGHFITEFAAKDGQSAAIDSEGNFYVFRNNGEVVRYEPSEYEGEAGKIEYGNPPVLVASGAFQGSVAVDAANDQVLIARDAINRYKAAADAEPNGLIETYEPEGLSWTEAMAVDAQRRRIYVSYCADLNNDCGIKVLDADNPEEVLETIDGSTVPAKKFSTTSGRLPVAVDEGTGDFFIADPLAERIYRFNDKYEFLSQQIFDELEVGIQIAVSNGKRSPAAEACKYPDPEDVTVPAGDACNRHYLFVPVFSEAGRVAAFRPPVPTAPVIEGVAVSSVGETEAELEATIFPGGKDTEYHFELTSLETWEAEGFNGAKTTFPTETIDGQSLATEVSVFATGLTPGQSYRFRVVAKNDKGPAEEDKNEATFATYNDAPISGGCPNEALRLGPSGLLPDCRAYELVTPADTNGRPPKGTGTLGSVFPTLQASPAGEAVSYTIEGGSLPDTSGTGSFFGDPYVARRASTGWNSKLEGPTGAEATKTAPGSFSPDQDYSFWQAGGEGPLVIPGSIITEYLHYPDGHSELIGRGSEGTEPRATGKLITENGTHIVFQSRNLGLNKAVKIEPNAPPEGTIAVYDRTIDPVTGEEETHVVSLLPGDVTPEEGEDAKYEGASKDGEGIAFSIGNSLYLRVGNQTTYKAGDNATFAGVSEGGDRIFYLQGGKLKALDTSSEETIEFTTTTNTVPVNVSADGSRAYFVSTSVFSLENPLGELPKGGKPNLYLSEEGSIAFVATVTERDVKGITGDDGLGLWTGVLSSAPAKDPSRLNPAGTVLLFQSRAEITGYPASEFPQIYRYTTAGELQCVSCIPTMQPATGGASLESYTFDTFTPKPFGPSAFVPNLNPQGTRVLFDSTEALVSTDTNGVNDVYEWEANGVGSCTRPQGCLYLISTGQSEGPNYLYGHSSSGNDVFFTTGETLTGRDSAGGAVSIYDARVNGGFPEPAGEDCVGDGCRPSVSPTPDFGKPEAGGEGNVSPKKTARTCPKGKRKVKKNGKVRCVKKKQKGKGGKAKQRAGAERGAGR